MKYEKPITLQNGMECVLRSANAADAKEVYDNFNLTHGQTDFLLSYPEENSYDVEQEGKFLAEKESSADEVELCAVVGGRIIGTASIETIGRKDKVKHRTEFGISIDKEYWGLGIGRALTEACIECAKKAGCLQIELSVVAANVTAISLYEKVGFVEYGRNPRGFRSRTSGWQEIILMRLPFDE
ncbi:MAG TPA: GNAT family N-acetyltransferase [Eubacteriales bacterium]|nr:GNAT family N-acetyltransferase [Clostridia bacterium]HRV73131.1 GNAT family N-acetyltransferase [Eubacteriales bacterium]